MKTKVLCMKQREKHLGSLIYGDKGDCQYVIYDLHSLIHSHQNKHHYKIYRNFNALSMIFVQYYNTFINIKDLFSSPLPFAHYIAICYFYNIFMKTWSKTRSLGARGARSLISEAFLSLYNVSSNVLKRDQIDTNNYLMYIVRYICNSSNNWSLGFWHRV